MNDNELQQKIISVVSYFFFFFFHKNVLCSLRNFSFLFSLKFLSQYFNQSPSNLLITKLSFLNYLSSFFSLCQFLKINQGNMHSFLSALMNDQLENDASHLWKSTFVFSRIFLFIFHKGGNEIENRFSTLTVLIWM